MVIWSLEEEALGKVDFKGKVISRWNSWFYHFSVPIIVVLFDINLVIIQIVKTNGENAIFTIATGICNKDNIWLLYKSLKYVGNFNMFLLYIYNEF